ncbi:hypothetical protein IFM89_004244 [Coptis chinensis]|uniref:Fe2OG dioxygenase domain-containing protein n=1 Tax=Coptis chinensis TaxID=261450 RepID=A0A835M3P0_9MAGN|nr:hypothetical protein IFM89_004244 [Coptis chinensis]
MISSVTEIYPPVNLHHIAPLDFSLVREVPDSHAWPQLGSYSSGVEMVPVIDLNDTNVVKLVGQACETWGVFNITNHGISNCLLEEVESESRRLFSLPSQQKLKVLRSPDGITGYGLPRISPFFSKIMWHEGFTIRGNVLEEYQKEMKKLAERLLSVMVGALGIAREDVNWANPLGDEVNGAQTTLQLNSYPACPEPDRAMGMVPHTDTSLFTILCQSSTSGLQIFRDEVGWLTLPPQTGALTVNVGDLLHILSNARFPSVLHRAIVNNTHHRISTAFFYAPPISAQISPSSRLIDHQAPKYRSMSCGEYIGIKAKHLEKALSLVRL